MIKRTLLLCSCFLALLSPSLGQEIEAKGLTFGEISIEQAAKLVEKAIGPPDLKGEKIEEAASGEILEEWHYGSLGLFIEMAQLGLEAPQRVYRISATEPSTWKWLDLVGIGTSQAELHQIFSRIPEDDSIEIARQDENVYALFFTEPHMIVGFELRGGLVSEIFLGPGPE